MKNEIKSILFCLFYDILLAQEPMRLGRSSIMEPMSEILTEFLAQTHWGLGFGTYSELFLH